MPSSRKNSGREGKCEGKCEGKKATLTLALTLFVFVSQSVTAKSEGVRAKNKKKLFSFIKRLLPVLDSQ